MSLLEQVFNILIIDGFRGQYPSRHSLSTQSHAKYLQGCRQGAWCVDILESEEYSCILVDEKEASLDFIKQQSIDLLLVFFNMDSKGNCKRLRNIKAELSERYVPVIVLTESFSEQGYNQRIELFCDDFLVMPLNQVMLKIKVRCLLNIRRNRQKQLENDKKNLEYQQVISHKQLVAANLYDKILSSSFLKTSVVKSSLSPESLFKGDLLFVSRTPDNNLYVLLGDFSGHGVLSVTNLIADIFYRMTDKGFDIIEIAMEINRKLYKLLPVNMFLAATMVALYPDSKSLYLITCGLPEHFLVNRKNNTLETISSCNVPLGIQPDCKFETQTYKVCNDDYLYLLTDGIFEAENPDGSQFGFEAVVEAIKQLENSGFEALQAALDKHCNDVTQRNCLTYLELLCDVDNVPWKNTTEQQSHGQTEALNWKTMMEFDINALRKLNPVPVMVNALMEIQGLQEHQQAIFMIVTELFANALDHGLLKLDSSIKQSPEGFVQFYDLKAERLQTIEQGVLRLFISHQPTATGGQLTIKVRDSGDGFDYLASTADLESNKGFSGRGIPLLESLCSRLTYQGKGNCVTAVFDWER